MQKNIKLYKRVPSKQIIMSRPKERFVIDITYQAIELTKNKKTIYLLNILDHFSKFLISFKIANKKGKTISEKLDICFKIFGCPEQIGAVNGREFNNKHVKILLNKYNIKLINLKPYNPHSQDTVEKVHKTVKAMLICKYLENKQKFNLENSLKLVVDVYNDTKHRTTLFTPNEIFNCLDEEILGTVKKILQILLKIIIQI